MICDAHFMRLHGTIVWCVAVCCRVLQSVAVYSFLRCITVGGCDTEFIPNVLKMYVCVCVFVCVFVCVCACVCVCVFVRAFVCFPNR